MAVLKIFCVSPLFLELARSPKNRIFLSDEPGKNLFHPAAKYG
ncbi:hypothetical protein PN499_00855 [Kamptonema animale CS-326]|nr:hypothetical protein [Kamptonema animale]MDB9509754.1 hypothetical protein [Kamptonema animale CS-326]